MTIPAEDANPFKHLNCDAARGAMRAYHVREQVAAARQGDEPALEPESDAILPDLGGQAGATKL